MHEFSTSITYRPKKTGVQRYIPKTKAKKKKNQNDKSKIASCTKRDAKKKRKTSAEQLIESLPISEILKELDVNVLEEMVDKR